MYADCQADIQRLEGEIASCRAKISGVQALIDAAVSSNNGLSQTIADCQVKNQELSVCIHDLEVSGTALEARLVCLRHEQGQLKECNAFNLDTNSKVQGEVTSLRSHVSVVNGQNS